jgi:hypothetical protein
MFISDDGEAVIGDLPPEGQMMPDDEPFQKAWGFLRRTGVRKIYPSHAGSFELTERPGG